MKFNELGLSDKVLQAVEASGYTVPTPIQIEAIPVALSGRDVLGIAQTGTGKTAAFTLPMLSRLEGGRARARMPRTLILEPTRELAAQVEEAFGKYGINHKLNVALLIGGVSFSDQEAKITRGADVLIATPGRLLDFAERGKLLLTGIEILVIDEADRMLDMGFIPDIEKICKLVPFTRQTLFFSATMPPEITKLTETFLHNPVRIEVGPAVLHRAGRDPGPGGLGAGVRQARDAPADCCGVPKTSTTRSSSRTASATWLCLTKSLEKHGFSVGCLHGRHGPARPHDLARRLPERGRQPAGLLGCRGPGPRHPGREPRVQLRRSDPCRGLRASHWPDRAGGPKRDRNFDRHPQRPEIRRRESRS